MEFALFTTAFMCVLGGGAFLISTLTVEKDRKVRKKGNQRLGEGGREGRRGEGEREGGREIEEVCACCRYGGAS